MLTEVSHTISNQWNRIGSKPSVFFWVLGISIGAIQAARYRYELSSNDIIAYLDIADAYLEGDWLNAINGNWSPLYSWLLAFFSLLLKPSGAWEFPFVKLVNFFIFVFALASFDFFTRQFLYYYESKFISKKNQAYLVVPRWVWLWLGYSIFLVSSLEWIGVYCDTPDLLNAGIIYLATGLVLNTYRYPKKLLSFVALGGVLALGYFSRAAMFPLGFIVLLASLFINGTPKKVWPRVLVALIVFLLASSFYITALSVKKGKLTFSETGNLSYVWYIHPTMRVVPDTLWQGEHPEFGTPKNPLRKIFEAPEILEFKEPIGGTYPLWSDPSYWYEGVVSRFHLESSLKILALNIQFYWKMFLGLLVFSYLTFLVWSDRLKSAPIDLLNSWPLLLIATSGLGAYALSTNLSFNTYEYQPSSRFISAFVVLLLAGVYSSVRLPNTESAKRVIASLTLVSTVFLLTQVGTSGAKNALGAVLRPRENTHWQIATEMKQLGLAPGDQIAFFGNESQRSSHIYWAKLAEVQIIAQLKKPETFWEKDKATQTAALEALKQAGVDAVVQAQSSAPENQPGWQKLKDSQYYAFFF